MKPYLYHLTLDIKDKAKFIAGRNREDIWSVKPGDVVYIDVDIRSLKAVDMSPLDYLMRPRPPMSCNISIHIGFMTCLIEDHMPGVPLRNQTDIKSAIKFLTSFRYLKAWCLRRVMKFLRTLGRRKACH